MKQIATFITCLFSIFAFAQKSIEIGKTHTISSKYLNQNRELSVALPASYHNSKFVKVKYPIVYVLDGETNFNFVTAVVEKFANGNSPIMPEMIVVGIKSDDRYKDFTSTYHESNPTSGKSEIFTQFLQQEVIPFIDKNYRTTNYKILVGHSLTGLYALELMLKNPNSFNAYIAHDPSIWWNNLQFLKNVESRDNDLSGSRVFISQAGAENSAGRLKDHYDGIKSVKTTFETPNTTNPIFKQIQYIDENHGSVPLKGNIDALRWVFNDYAIDMRAIEKNGNLVQDSFEKFSATRNETFLPSETYLLKVIAYLQRVQATESLQVVMKYYEKLYPTSAQLKTLKSK